MKLSGENVAEIRKRCLSPLSQLSEGANPVDIAAEMYSECFPEKSDKTALMVAWQMSKTVTTYHDNVEQAQKDCDGWVMKNIEHMAEGLDDVEAFRQLYQSYISMVAIAADSGDLGEEERVETTKWLERESRRVFRTEDVTEEKTEQLRRKFAEALKDASRPIVIMEEISDWMEDDDTVDQVVAGMEEDRKGMEIILAMETYLEAKTGQMGQVSQNINPETAALGICSAVEIYELIDDSKNPSFEDAEDEAVTVLYLFIVAAVTVALLLACLNVGGDCSQAVNVGVLVGGYISAWIATLMMANVRGKNADKKSKSESYYNRLREAGGEKADEVRESTFERMRNIGEFGGTVIDDEENNSEETYVFA